MYLLASQAVDKCQSQEGAESALADIERFLETAQENQLTELRNIHNQYELVLSDDVKVSQSHARMERASARAVSISIVLSLSFDLHLIVFPDRNLLWSLVTDPTVYCAPNLICPSLPLSLSPSLPPYLGVGQCPEGAKQAGGRPGDV